MNILFWLTLLLGWITPREGTIPPPFAASGGTLFEGIIPPPDTQPRTEPDSR